MSETGKEAALLAVRSNAGLEVHKQNNFCLSCLGTGGRWYARFTGLRLPEWKKCKCITANVQIEGQPASGLSRSNAGLCVKTTEG